MKFFHRHSSGGERNGATFFIQELGHALERDPMPSTDPERSAPNPPGSANQELRGKGEAKYNGCSRDRESSVFRHSSPVAIMTGLPRLNSRAISIAFAFIRTTSRFDPNGNVFLSAGAAGEGLYSEMKIDRGLRLIFIFILNPLNGVICIQYALSDHGQCAHQ